MLKFSIIINTHNQQNYIFQTINSCLNQKYKNYEIIIIDTSEKKISLKEKLYHHKKIKYFHYVSKYNQPELNQMNKIFLGFKKSKGKYLIFLDGDDKFDKNKLLKLDKLINKKKILCNQDLPIIFNKNFSKKLKIKTYKIRLFKFFLNDWPQIYGTSSITVKRNILKVFFNKAKPFKWSLLAIDAQIILFCKKYYEQTNYLSKITYKRMHENNLGEDYLNIFKKKFWLRRKMQFEFSKFINDKNKFSIDYFITKIICTLLLF
tara:strand:- start:1719 stop:2504 length:786 start_codon:yes stop_codon:yes gene_type:complete